MHDLVMQRTQLVEAIGREKRSEGLPPLHPGREALILRRLAARHHGSFSPSALVRMWREMLAVTVGLQGRFAIAVYAPDGVGGFWDLARDHFGSHTPMTPYRSAGQVIRAVTDHQASVGVLPTPQEDDADPWWRFLVSGDAAAPRVIARLPFAGRGNARAGDALAVGGGRLEATGEDRSLLAVETRGNVSRTRLSSAMAQAGFQCTFFAAFEPGTDTVLNLVELAEFVTPDDCRLGEFSEQLGAGCVERIVSLGHYAVPLTLAVSSGAAAAARLAR